MPTPLREVAEREFWDFIRKLDVNVHPRPVGKYPYTSIFETPDRVEYGRIVSVLEGGVYPPVSRHYIKE